MASYVIGVDFGTESGRAVVIDTTDGQELGSSVYPYANGVIDEALPAPDDDVRLAPEWALQDPDDYIRTFQHAVPAAIAQAGVDAADVIGVATDFTACTMLPTKADGTPLADAARVPSRSPRLGEAVEAPRRPARGGPHQRDRQGARRGLAAPLRRQDLIGVVLLQGPADPRRIARHLRRRGPDHRGGRLGHLAPDRERAAQQLHRRLQGHLVQAGRLPRRRLLRGAGSAPGHDRRREDVARGRLDRRQGGRADRGSRGLDGPAARDGGGGGQRRRPCLGAGRDGDRARAAWSWSWAPARATW